MKIILLAIGCCAYVFRAAEGNCGPCPPPPKHYAEFNCTGIALKQGQCCPVKYICPNLAQLDRGKCHYNSNIYRQDEIIPEAETPLCVGQCQCSRVGKYPEVVFKCDNIRQQRWEPEDHDCVRQYSLNECRHVGRVCGQQNIDQLGSCYWHGTKYYEGERFEPKSDPNYLCICDQHFDNGTSISHNDRNCFERQCGLYLNYFAKFRWGCVPVYSTEGAYCPTDEWICPSAEKRETTREDMSCVFGDQLIEQWKYLETVDKCLECRCDLPPILTCIRKANCLSETANSVK